MRTTLLESFASLKSGKENAFLLIAGPCVIENESTPLFIAEHLIEVCENLGIPLIFKASYEKANRSKLDSFVGIGRQKAMNILSGIRKNFNVPITTDVHNVEQVNWASEYVDILQIPAFLCRQTELLLAAGQTQKWVNVKKGQFLSPDAMKFVVDKVKSTSNSKIMLTERGTTFGYSDLVVDFRSFPIMNEMDAVTVMDCTHSLQKPNQKSGVTGGSPGLIETMAKGALATGARALFIETHQDPSIALSDGANMLKLSKIEDLLKRCLDVYHAVAKHNT